MRCKTVTRLQPNCALTFIMAIRTQKSSMRRAKGRPRDHAVRPPRMHHARRSDMKTKDIPEEELLLRTKGITPNRAPIRRRLS